MSTPTQTNDFLLGQKEQSQRKDDRKKNYAPIDPRIATLEKAPDLYTERAKKKQVTMAKQLEQTYEIQALANTRSLSTRRKSHKESLEYLAYAKREHNREHYKVRKMFHKMTAIEAAIPEPLNPLKRKDLDVERRLREFNKNHKCKHFYGFNILNHHPFEMIANLEYYTPDCDHDKFTLDFAPLKLCKTVYKGVSSDSISSDNEKSKGSCFNCGTFRFYDIKSNYCDCLVKACAWCKRIYYCHEDCRDLAWTNNVQYEWSELHHCKDQKMINAYNDMKEFLNQNVKTGKTKRDLLEEKLPEFIKKMDLHDDLRKKDNIERTVNQSKFEAYVWNPIKEIEESTLSNLMQETVEAQTVRPQTKRGRFNKAKSTQLVLDYDFKSKEPSSQSTPKIVQSQAGNDKNIIKEYPDESGVYLKTEDLLKNILDSPRNFTQKFKQEISSFISRCGDKFKEGMSLSIFQPIMDKAKYIMEKVSHMLTQMYTKFLSTTVALTEHTIWSRVMEIINFVKSIANKIYLYVLHRPITIASSLFSFLRAIIEPFKVTNFIQLALCLADMVLTPLWEPNNTDPHIIKVANAHNFMVKLIKGDSYIDGRPIYPLYKEIKKDSSTVYITHYDENLYKYIADNFQERLYKIDKIIKEGDQTHTTFTSISDIEYAFQHPDNGFAKFLTNQVEDYEDFINKIEYEELERMFDFIRLYNLVRMCEKYFSDLPYADLITDMCSNLTYLEMMNIFMDFKKQHNIEEFATVASTLGLSVETDIHKQKVTPQFGVLSFENMRYWNMILSGARNLIDLISRLAKCLPTIVKKMFGMHMGFKEQMAYKFDNPEKFEDDVFLKAHTACIQTLAAAQINNNFPSRDNQAVYESMRRQSIIAMEKMMLAYNVQGLFMDREAVQFVDGCNKILRESTKLQRYEEPFTIWVSSSPGMGKSTFWPYLLQALPIFNTENGPLSIAEIRQRAYIRNPAAQYWDGYNCEKHDIIVYDDFAQDREELDISELISLVSRADYIPPMASLDNYAIGVKGTILKPKVVVLLSNFETVDPTTIKSSQAVNRRKHFQCMIEGTELVPLDKQKFTIVTPRDCNFLNFSTPADFTNTSNYLRNNTFVELILALRAFYEVYNENNQKVSDDNVTIDIGKILSDYDHMRYTSGENMRTYLKKCSQDGYSTPRESSVDRGEIKIQRMLSGNVKTTGKIVTPQFGPRYINKQLIDGMSLTASVFSLVGALTSILLRVNILAMEKQLFEKLREKLAKRFDCGFLTTLIKYQRLISEALYIGSLVLTSIGLIITALVVIEYFSGFISKMFGLKVQDLLTPNFEIQSYENNTKAGPKATKVTSQSNTEAPTTITRTLVKNVCKIRKSNGNFLMGTFIKGTLLLTVEHFFYDNGILMNDGDEFVIQTCDTAGAIPIKFKKSSLTPIIKNDGSSTDWCIYDCGTAIQARRDIVKHFNDNTNELKGRKVIMYTVDTNMGFGSYFVNRGEIVQDGVHVMYSDYCEFDNDSRCTHEHKQFNVRRTIEYDMRTFKGDCGALIMVDDPSFQGGVIVGLHVAACDIGNTTNGIASYVPREYLEKALAKMETRTIEVQMGLSNENHLDVDIVEVPQLINYDFLVRDALNMNLDGELQYVGKLKNAKIVGSSKTTIKPSVLQGRITTNTLTAPAVLNRNLIRKGINKYSKPSSNFPDKYLKLAKQSIYEELNGVSTIGTREKVSLQEAINGNKEIPYADRIDMSTSAGFPWNVMGYTGEKRQLFKYINDVDEYKPIPQLGTLLNARIDAYLNNKTLVIPWTVTLKDERRPLEKIEQQKTRIFAASPLDYVLISRMFNLRFVSSFYQSRIKTFSAVGISKESLEWHILINKLKTKASKGFCCDFSSWDGTVNKEVMLSFFDIINMWYNDGEENQKIRKLMALEIINAPQIFEQYVFMLNGGVSSGLDLTVVINTICNEIYFRIAWQALVPAKFKDLMYYRENVASAIYGDDAMFAVKDEFLQYFNLVTISKYFEQFGVTLTRADDKLGVLQEYVPVENFTFLKCAIGVHHFKYVPIYSELLCVEIILWIRKCPDEKKACMDNCNSALRMLFFHGRKIFDKWRNRILAYEPSFQLVSYDYLDENFLNYGHLNTADNDFGYSRSEKLNFNLKTIKESDDENCFVIGVISQSGKETNINMSQGTLDEPKQNIQQALGTNLVDQESIQVMAKPAPKGDKLARAYLQSDDWTLEKMMIRENYLTTFEWSLGQANKTVLWKADIVKDIIKSQMNATPFQHMTYFRCKGVYIVFKISGSRFVQGRLHGYFIPSQRTTANLGTEYFNNFSRQVKTTLLSCYIDPTKSEPVALYVPWTYFKGWYDLSNNESLGQVFLEIFNEYNGGTEAPKSATIQIYFHIDGPVFKEPRPTPALKASELFPRKVTPQMGLFNEIGQSLDDVVSEILPMNLIEDTVGALLDKPQISTNPDPIVMKSQTYLSQAVNVDFVDTLQLNAKDLQMTTKEHFSVAESNFSALYQKKSYMTSFEWTSESNVGDQLYTTLVGPMATVSLDKDIPNALNHLDYFSHMFSFWRGGLIFIFDIVSSALHEGHLIFNFSPAVMEQAKDLVEIQSQYTASVAVKNENNVFAIHCPFLSDTPYKMIWNGTALQEQWADEKNRFSNYFLGMLGVTVGSKLKVSPGTASKVQVNVFVMGAPDYETNYLGPNNSTLIPAFTEKEREAMIVYRRVRVQGGNEMVDLNKNESVTRNMITLGTKLGTTYDPIIANEKIKHFADDYCDIASICKRYIAAGRVAVTGLLTETNAGTDVFIGQYAEVTSISINPSLLANWRKILTCFRNIRGSMIVKVAVYPQSTNAAAAVAKPSNTIPKYWGYVTSNPNTASYLGNNLFVNSLTSIGGTNAGAVDFATTNNFVSPPRGYFNQDTICELKIPYLSIFPSSLITSPIESATASEACLDYTLNLTILTNVLQAYADTKLMAQVDICFGDETRIGTYIGYPSITPTYNSNGSYYPDEWIPKAEKLNKPIKIDEEEDEYIRVPSRNLTTKFRK